MRERIQKLLASRGVGSRRKVEEWIAAGRITVNGQPARPGQPVSEDDDVRLDGRRLRLRTRPHEADEGLAYHRPAQEAVRPGAGRAATSSLERLPKSAGRRWIPVHPMGARDGGLELFLTDGALAAALTRHDRDLAADYSVRVRGQLDEESLAREITAQARRIEVDGEVVGVEPAGGEGVNRWVSVSTVGIGPKDLRRLFEALGLEANRILRTRLGPVVMDRQLARGRSRRLTEDELRALREAAGLKPPGSRMTRR